MLLIKLISIKLHSLTKTQPFLKLSPEGIVRNLHRQNKIDKRLAPSITSLTTPPFIPFFSFLGYLNYSNAALHQKISSWFLRVASITLKNIKDIYNQHSTSFVEWNSFHQLCITCLIRYRSPHVDKFNLTMAYSALFSWASAVPNAKTF